MSPLLVVVEGPDGSGKTTLARSLEQEFGLLYRHEGPPPADVTAMTHYLSRLYDARLEAFCACARGVVLDRFAMGELVYGPLLRGGSRLIEWPTIRAELRSMRALMVTCLPPYEACHDAWATKVAEDRELIHARETHRASYDSFALLAVDPDNHQLIYDWTKPDAYVELAVRLA